MKRMDPRETLAAMVATTGSQRQVAADLGIAQAYLSDLINGRRPFSRNILTKLGMEQVIIRAERKSA